MNTTLKKPANTAVKNPVSKAKAGTPAGKAASSKKSPCMDSSVLRQAEALQASQLVMELDNAGHVIHANRRLLELLGMTSDELIGTPLSLLVPKTNQAAVLCKSMIQSLSSGKTEDGE